MDNVERELASSMVKYEMTPSELVQTSDALKISNVDHITISNCYFI